MWMEMIRAFDLSVLLLGIVGSLGIHWSGITPGMEGLGGLSGCMVFERSVRALYISIVLLQRFHIQNVSFHCSFCARLSIFEYFRLTLKRSCRQ